MEKHDGKERPVVRIRKANSNQKHEQDGINERGNYYFSGIPLTFFDHKVGRSDIE
jgi:hypothetical protein